MDYKQDIQNTRLGCLGSSDGKLLAQIANSGFVPNTAHQRLAVVKGLIPNKEIPQTAAVRAGDYIEQEIFKHLAKQDARYESNPLWVSAKYSKPNVKLISHPDIVYRDDNSRTLYVYEVKTTKFSLAETKNTYKAQLYIHNLLAKELATTLGPKWHVKLFLVVYDTNGLDLSQGCEFTTDRMTINECRFNAPLFDIERAMSIVNDFLASFDSYFEGDDIDANLLPEQVKKEFEQVTLLLREIREREDKVQEFKDKLYDFLQAKNIKSIKNEEFSVTRVDPSTSTSFDSKKFLEDFGKLHPVKVRKIKEQYAKTTQRKGFAKIVINKKSD